VTLADRIGPAAFSIVETNAGRFFSGVSKVC
jgi:hypothetical protein